MTYSYEALLRGLQDCQRWGGCVGMSVEDYAASIGATIEGEPPETKPETKPGTKPGTKPKPSGNFSYEALEEGLRECQRWGGCRGMSVEDYAKSLGGSVEYTKEQQAEFEAYLADYNSGQFPNMPYARNVGEYWEIRGQLMANSEYYLSPIQSTLEQWDQWERYQAYGSQYRDLEDYYYSNYTDFILNYDQGIHQLDLWIQEAGPEGVGFTDEQIRNYNNYKFLSQFGELGDWFAVDIGDFIAHPDKAQQMITKWTGLYEESEAWEQEQREYIEWSQEQAKYAAEEAYREPARLSETFSAWMGQQEQLSGAFSGFVESQYPSLRGEFEAGMPIETGYPTREEARAAAEQREREWAAWLPEQVPGMYQEYMSQPPLQRGERPYMYQQTMRTANW